MPTTAPPLCVNPLTLQLSNGLLRVDISLPECQLLEAFAGAAGQRLNTAQILDLASKTADSASKRALEVQIVRLRKKLRQAGLPDPTIKSIRGLGYQLCIPLNVLEAGTPLVTRPAAPASLSLSESE